MARFLLTCAFLWCTVVFLEWCVSALLGPPRKLCIVSSRPRTAAFGLLKVCHSLLSIHLPLSHLSLQQVGHMFLFAKSGSSPSACLLALNPIRYRAIASHCAHLFGLFKHRFLFVNTSTRVFFFFGRPDCDARAPRWLGVPLQRGAFCAEERSRERVFGLVPL